MKHKVLAVACIVLSGLAQVVIRHNDTALFYSTVLIVIAAYEFMIGVIGDRRLLVTWNEPVPNAKDNLETGNLETGNLETGHPEHGA
jgi:hypothetical protein